MHRAATLLIILLAIICCRAPKLASNPITLEIKNNRADSLFTNEDYENGRFLVRQSDCYTCHHTKEQNIGPSFHEISVKYQDVSDLIVDKLADKIRKGGGGVWKNVPMPPHPKQTNEELRLIVKSILLTKYKNS